MNLRHFEFDIEQEGKTIPATCDVYSMEEKQHLMPYKFPVYRVSLSTRGEKRGVFLFYERNEPGQKFYCYPIDDFDKRQLARTIAEALEKIS